ncbi:mur ligase family, catalytic domain protein, partial [Chlamydia psittaci 02DC14]
FQGVMAKRQYLR